MATNQDQAFLPEETVLWRTHPAWRSFLLYFVAMAVCGGGPLLKENPVLRPAVGLMFAGIFLLIILRRWSNVYTLTERRLTVREGLFAREETEVRLADVSGVETHQGLALRLVGTGHLLVRSRRPEQASLLVYGLPDPEGFKEWLEGLVAEAKAREGLAEEVPGEGPLPEAGP